MPKALAFGKQIFAMNKGRSVVPHGHDNMSTGFHHPPRHLRRPSLRPRRGQQGPLPDQADIDRAFKPGECSTVFRSQGQRALVSRRRRTPRRSSTSTWMGTTWKTEDADPRLRGPRRRKGRRRIDRREEDHFTRVPRKVRANEAPCGVLPDKAVPPVFRGRNLASAGRANHRILI